MHTEFDHTSVRLTLQADRRCTSALYKPHMFPIHIRNTVNSKFPTQLTEETCSTIFYPQILSHSSQMYWPGQCLMQNSPEIHHRLTGEANPWTPRTQSIGKLSRRPITFDRRTQLCIHHTNICYIIILFIYLFIRSSPRKNKGHLTYLPDKLRWPVRTAHVLSHILRLRFAN